MGDQPPAATSDTPDPARAKKAADAIEKIDPNEHGKAFVDHVTAIMKENQLNGNDATSKLVIAQLEKDKKLPRVLLELGDNNVSKALADGDGNYSKQQLEKIGRGEGKAYGTTTDAGSKLMANAMLSRFDAISGLDQLDHHNNDGQGGGKISKQDIQTYGAERQNKGQGNEEKESAFQLDQKRVENRPGVEQMLNAVSESNDKSPQALQKLKAGQPVSAQELKDALQEDAITRKVAAAQGLTPEQMGKLGLMSDKDKQAMEFLRDHYDKITGVQDGAKDVNGDILKKYAKIMGTSTDIANANVADQKALDTPTVVQPPTVEDPTKADPKKAKDAATAIAGIPADKHGADYAGEVNKIMDQNGLHGNDASSKLMIAELERQGKLPQFLAETLGNDDARKALGGNDGYSKEQLENLAKGQTPVAGAEANSSTRLAAQALLDRFSAVADLDNIDHNNDGDKTAREGHKNLITVGDIKTYAGTQISADDSGHASVRALDQKRVQFREGVNDVLRSTTDVKETDPDIFKRINANTPVSQQDIKDALQTDAITRKVAAAQGLTEEQMKKLNLMTPEQTKSLQFMQDHYSAITGMEDNSKGITNKLLDTYATNMGTNRDIAKMQAEQRAALDKTTDAPTVTPPGNTGDLDKRSDAINDAVRALPDKDKEPFLTDGMTKAELQAVLDKDAKDQSLTQSQRDTFTALNKDWDTIVPADAQNNRVINLEDFAKKAMPHFDALDKDAQAKLAGISGKDMSVVVNEKGEIDKGKLDALLANKEYTTNANADEKASYEYLSDHFNDISHDGKVITHDQLATYAKTHKFEAYQDYKDKAEPTAPEKDPKLEAARAKVDAFKQEDALAAGEPPYNLAARALQERAKLTGEKVDHSAIMREVARLVIANEIGPENVRQNLQKMLDSGAAISDKNLPKALNGVKIGQPLKLYTDAEKEAIAKRIAARDAGDTSQDGNYGMYGGT
jgi:hypothetical protein